jgi:hypothetical protein
MPPATLERVEPAPPSQPPTSPQVDARRRAIAAEIGALLEAGLPLPGSLVERCTRCGNPGCRCRGEPPQLHGPYLSWTRKIDGKTVTRTLSPDQADRYRAWFHNARRLRELLAELERLALE